MVTAITLLNVQRQAINETAQRLLEIEGVAEVYSVAGDWDLVAMIRAWDNDALAEIVTNRLLQIETITKSQTLIAFRAFSKFNLEAMFSIGFEEDSE